MVANFVIWLLRVLKVERHDITRRGTPYLVRWVLYGQRYADSGGKVFLHRFHASDPDGALHDHPWRFWSLILWGGYWEHTPDGRRTWYWPGRLLRRPAEWKHRVEIPAGRKVWTLLWTSDKVRSWGFDCVGGFVGWRDYVGREEAGLPGCGE